ncbi:MAG: T9SS type A sorting domain-containing protein [Sphingobacteriales bacterium]|nr:MAG: T9SS type A sorting domain-containing protein [Sphingobacteriales bacterium]
MPIRICCIYIICFFLSLPAFSQEMLAPLGYNPARAKRNVSAKPIYAKTTALTLPFFEDFTYEDDPDTTRWVERQVYVNNTMGIKPVSRGIATFDGLDQNGIPYDPVLSTHLLYADSLTSQVIDLSTLSPADSVYLSFFYQPQGNGFYPEASDSLIVYMKRKITTGAWVKVWAIPGSQLQPFKQAMVAVTNPDFFHADFQFRFVNKASVNTNDDVWNVDYIRMAAGRNMYDTLINDVAFSSEPTFILNDYTYMPYHQFMVNPSGELAPAHAASINNLSNSPASVQYDFTATELLTGTPLANETGGPISIAPRQEASLNYSTYANNIPNGGQYQRAVFENKYFIQARPGEPVSNDTIVREQKFENYLAYDDGSAEKSYYLKLGATLPGKTAIEYRLNRKDTLLGVAIYFARQVPMAGYKDFSVAVYRELGSNGAPDVVAFQQNFLFPGYLNTNHFYFYKFDSPVILDKGTFFMGTIQPASGVSDSLYFGLDANRITGNHAYFNVGGFWEPSAVSGAVMIRPVIGWIIASDVPEVPKKEELWGLYPNPATDIVKLNYSFNHSCTYEITNTQGRVVQSGALGEDRAVNIQLLMPGVYYMHLKADGILASPQKLVKY